MINFILKLNNGKNKMNIFYFIVLLGLLNSNLSAFVCENKLFNLKVTNFVTPYEILSQISDECEFSIAIKDKYSHNILNQNIMGINLKDSTIYEILDILVTGNELLYEFNKNTLQIYGIKTKTFKIDYITSNRTGSAVISASVDATPRGEGEKADKEAMGQNSITSEENFNFWETIATEITSLLNNNSDGYVAPAPIINQKAGFITVTGTKNQIKNIEQYLKDLQEKLHKQVMIDVSIISVTYDDSKSRGVDWSSLALMINNPVNSLGLGGTTGSNSLKIQNDDVYGNTNNLLQLDYNNIFSINNTISFTMDGLISFLDKFGDTKVVSSPKILTLNNQQALITIGDNINYRVPSETSSSETGASLAESYENYSIFIGVLLNILPEIAESGEIMLRVNPSISNFKYDSDDTKQDVPREIAPDTSEKKLSSVVRVKDGHTIILGGLIGKRNGVTTRGVPILGDIPLLGYAFKNESTAQISTELVFVITPKIIQGDQGSKTLQDHNLSLKSLGFSVSDGISEPK